MKKTKIKYGALALLVGAIGASTAAHAYQGDPNVRGPDCSEERHTAMVQVFTNNDYTAWKELMADKGRVTEAVTEENFAEFAEAHTRAKEGDIERAKEIRQALGLGQGEMRHGKGAHRSGAPMQQKKMLQLSNGR